MTNEQLDILSLGVGWQSSALYFMSALGELPRIDYAIVSDVGGEPKTFHWYLKFMLQWQKENNGPEIIVTNSKNLEKDLLNNTNSDGNRFSSIPAFTKNDDGSTGMLRRQCTGEYKIEQVDKAIRNIYGLKPRARNIPTRIWKGITADELVRIDKPGDKWKTLVYPFCGYELNSTDKPKQLAFGKIMHRNELPSWFRLHNLPLPSKSSCKFCPYHSDTNWLDLKTNAPDDFADAVKIDYAIRNSTEKGINNPIYLHRSLKPLDQVQFDETQNIPFGECSGTCNT